MPDTSADIAIMELPSPTAVRLPSHLRTESISTITFDFHEFAIAKPAAPRRQNRKKTRGAAVVGKRVVVHALPRLILAEPPPSVWAEPLSPWAAAANVRFRGLILGGAGAHPPKIIASSRVFTNESLEEVLELPVCAEDREPLPGICIVLDACQRPDGSLDSLSVRWPDRYIRHNGDDLMVPVDAETAVSRVSLNSPLVLRSNTYTGLVGLYENESGPMTLLGDDLVELVPGGGPHL